MDLYKLLSIGAVFLNVKNNQQTHNNNASVSHSLKNPNKILWGEFKRSPDSGLLGTIVSLGDGEAKRLGTPALGN